MSDYVVFSQFVLIYAHAKNEGHPEHCILWLYNVPFTLHTLSYLLGHNLGHYYMPTQYECIPSQRIANLLLKAVTKEIYPSCI